MQTCSQYWDDGVLCMNVALKGGKCDSTHLRADYPPPPSGKRTFASLLACPAGATSPNDAFAALASSETPSNPYKRRIEAIESWGASSGGQEMVHGVACLHDTQKANNCTVWYSWKGDRMTVWGLGSHSGGSGAGNNKYSMTWYDGKSKNWTRG